MSAHAQFPARRLTPAGRFGAAAAAGGALAVCCLGAVEVFWRVRGGAPSVDDSPALWALAAARAPAGDPDVLALVGTSRMHSGFDPAVWRARFPGRPAVQLAIAGKSPFPVLRRLAGDGAFVGLAVVGITEEHLGRAAPADLPHTRRPAPRSWGERAATRLTAFVDSLLTVASSRVGWYQVQRGLRAGRGFGGATYAFMDADRWRRNEYARTDVAARRAESERSLRKAVDGSVDPAAWLAGADIYAATARRIADRGGRVAFVRMPTAGPCRALLANRCPRGRFWDRFAARLGGGPSVTAIHFEDVPGMRGLSIPDWSHLDAADRPAFTRALLDELARRGLL